MEGIFALATLIGLGFLLGSVFGWVAFIQLNDVRKRLERLQRELDMLHQTGQQPASQTAPPAMEPSSLSIAASPPSPAPAKISVKISRPAPAIPPAAKAGPPRWLQHLQANWMIWLGGTSVGLSGIFLVKYSIDAGLISPTARVCLAVLFGIAFHGLALWLKKRTRFHYDAFAALAGGASIMIYAALLAAVHLYQLWSPGLVFTLLALVSVATMVLALQHGPVLAGIGILGAYLVPLLVSTGSHNIVGALIYATLITVSALWLMRYVYRIWLWIGTLFGALCWWLIGLSENASTETSLIYLCCLSYGIIAIDTQNWLFHQIKPLSAPSSLLAVLRDKQQSKDRRKLLSLFAILAAQLITLAQNDLDSTLFFSLLLPSLLLWLCRCQSQFSLLGWSGFAVTISGILAAGLLQGNYYLHGTSGKPEALLMFLATIAGIHSLASLWILRSTTFKGYWASLAALGPVVSLATGYVLVTSLSTHWEWAVIALLLGASYLFLLQRQRVFAPPVTVVASLIIAAHFAYSLAVTMVLREATLTLALAVQIITLVWLDRQYRLPILTWGVKILLAVVISRLTLNPWLLTYPQDTHWSLWVCGGSFIATFIATRMCSRNTPLYPWLQGAALHLLALTLIFEVRYQLYDGAIFSHVYSFTEAAINTSVWGLLGNVYLFRARTTEHLQRFYIACATLLLMAALVNYAGVSLLVKNPLWTHNDISSTPLFNLLLLAYGVPIALAALTYIQIPRRYKTLAGATLALMLWYFVSIEIRHLWHGELALSDHTSDGEHYSYSMAWLVLAVLGSVTGIRFARQTLYRGAMLFLMCVVGKIFLFDMSGLTGLWRVASFMALGLCLLGLAWLHQFIRRQYVSQE